MAPELAQPATPASASELGTREPSASPESTVPQKRKAVADADEHSQSAAVDIEVDDEHDQLPEGDGDEFAAGKVACDVCGEAVTFRDPETGRLQIEKWHAHKRQCSAAAAAAAVALAVSVSDDAKNDGDGDNDVDAEGSPADQLLDLPPVSSIATSDAGDSNSPAPSAPPLKRRRAKRTEEERIEYLHSDPYVARFEPYRVLCASCDKWIRLRPNSTYCSIPWDAHRKSCLAKKGGSAVPTTARSTAFAGDPSVKRFDATRVHCRSCSQWIFVGANDDGIAVWHKHRASCEQPSATSASAAPAGVPPPSKEQLAFVSMSITAPSVSSPPPSEEYRAPKATSEILAAAHAHAQSQASSGGQESRRRNADQRAAILRQDPLLSEVEPHRVYCSLCQKWVQLRQDSTYCANPWQQHRAKCIVRAEKKERKARDLTSRTGGAAGILRVASLSANGALTSDMDVDGASHGDAMDIDAPTARSTPRSATGHILADLDTPSGRVAFIQRSITHLYGTTYERSDDLTLAALLAYLNCAVPPDKHEDFDTAEVLGAATTLQARGVLELRGDILHPLMFD